MQYPHTILVTGAGSGTPTDANGNWTPAEPTEAVQYEGRFEAAGNGTPKPVVDGVVTDFTGIVYLPIPETPLQRGQGIEVWRGENQIARGTVLQYLEGDVLRKNARVWL